MSADWHPHVFVRLAVAFVAFILFDASVAPPETPSAGNDAVSIVRIPTDQPTVTRPVDHLLQTSGLSDPTEIGD